MASGGQQTPSRGIHPSSSQVNQHGGNEFGDSQWTLLPNNLELNSRSRPAKKQRNKEKIRKVVSTESSPSPRSSPCATRNCNHPYSASSYPRTKFTSTSWHNEQMASGALKKNITSSDMEETTSDNELINMERRNIERVPSQRHQEPRFQDRQTPSSRRVVVDSEPSRSYKEDNTKKVPDASVIIERLIHLRECIKQVTSIMQNLEKSDEPIAREQMNKLDHMLTQLHQEEEEHLELLQQMLDSSHAAELSDGPGTSHLSTSGSFTLLPSREVNGISEDERMDHKDQILRKMMESQKKLTALQQQQEALMSLQKKAKDKLAEAKAFHEHLVKTSSSESQQDKERAGFQPQDWQYAASDRSYHSGCVEEPVPNGNTDWEGDQSDVQVVRQPHTVRSERKTQSGGQVKRNSNASSSWQEETREMAATNALNANLEDLRHRVQLLQERNDNRKMAAHCNDQEEEEDPTVEWHRQKLENKLRELQEKKQQMNQLLQELSSLQEASKSGAQQLVASGDGDVPVETVATLRDAQQFLETVDTGEKRKKLDHMKETLRQLRAMVNNIGSPVNGEEAPEFEDLEQQVQKEKTEPLPPQQHRQPSQTKRDNISREQCGGFPARRHYEAEGRANEDTDIAPPPPVVASSPPLSPRASWDTDPQIQEKMRQLQDAKDKLKKVQGLLAVVQQSKSTGETLPSEYLQLLASFDDEEDSGGGSEPNQRKDDAAASQSSSKNLTDGEVSVTQRRPREQVRIDDIKERIHQQQENTLEHFKEERHKLLALQEQLVRLQQTPDSSVKNNDHVRSSGEGDSLQKRPHFNRSGPIFTPAADPEHLQNSRERPRQGNLLLTRQNVAIMESQSSTENNTTVKARDIASAKKDNINSLSANLTRKMLATSPACMSSEQSLESRAAASLSALTAELSQNLSLRDEMCRKKAAIEELLSQDQSKQQSYSRNQDTQSHSGSSVISGPLEGSSSVLAPDTTVAATWGGSSTQDNFENEVEEPVESLEEQEEGSGNESQVEGGAQHDQSRYLFMQQFPGEQVYVEHSTSSSAPLTRRDNRIGKKQGFKSQESQPVTRKNFQRVGGNRKFPCYEGIHQENLPADVVVDEPEGVNQQPAPLADGSSGLVYWHKFTQQFQQQLEHMNALCQSVLQEQQVLTSRLLSCSFSSPTLIPGRSSHPVIPDLLQQYTHQLQQQQQLLLSLSQCYHMLYLQQIEIQHLQKCVQQSPDSDGAIHQTPPLNNQGPSTEEFTLRPWPVAPVWNAPLPFSQTQPSLLATSFIQPTSFGYGPTHPVPNVAGCTSQNVRNNSGPEVRAVSETLNNQVPPRTRANNFWDNFRSYSRQNLLSTSAATKSNESASVGGGQVRYTTQQTAGTDGSCWNSRARDSLQPRIENGTVPLQTSEDRPLERPLPNPELQEMMTRPKKPNFNKHQVTGNRTVSEAVRRSPASLNLSTFTPLDQMSRPSTFSCYTAPNVRSGGLQNTSSTSSTNTSTPCPQHLGSKLRENASGSSTLPFGSVQESIYAEVAKLVAQNESHPDFLVELFQQLQQIHSDYLRQRALCTVRDMVACQGSDMRLGSFVDRTELDENQTMNQLSKDMHLQSNHSQMEVQDHQSFPDGTSDLHHQLSSASNDQPVSGRCSSGDSGHCQESATASIRPQQKPGICTGAVKKKSSKPVLPHTSVPQRSATAELEGFVQQNGASMHKSSLEPLEAHVERAVLGLVPFISNHLHEECSPQFQAHLVNRLLESLQTLPQQHLTRLFRSQILQNTLAKFTGKKISGCEDEMLMQISNVLFKEVALHKLTKKKPQKHEDNQEGSVETSKDNSLSEKSETPVACNEFLPDQLKAQKEVTAEYSEETEEISRGDRKVSDHHVATSHMSTSEQEVSRGVATGEPNAFVSRALPRNLPSGVRTAEEDMGCESETELEVEAETEADLAEADQSPSQLGATVDQLTRQIESSLSVPDGGGATAGPLPGIAGMLQSMSASGATAAYIEDSITVEDEHTVNDDSVGQGAFSEGSLIQELILDDIPTKLSPTPEEMMQRHISDEPTVNSLHQESLGDTELAASGDGEITAETSDYYS